MAQKATHWHTVLTHAWLRMCPQWLGVTSVFRLSPVIWFTGLLGSAVLLFWSGVLSRGVSSFGYGVARQGIFRCVYFEVITLRCFCLSDSMLLHSFILCPYGPACSTVQTGGHLWAGRHVFEYFSIGPSFNLFAVSPFSPIHSHSLFLCPWLLHGPSCLSHWHLTLHPLSLAPACLVWYKYRVGLAWWGRVSVWGCGQFCSFAPWL